MLGMTRGALLTWNNLDNAAFEMEFNDWYNRQHLYERVSIAGVIRGRRFRALKGSRLYSVIYETTSPAVFAGEEYLASVNNPLERTRAALKYFSGTVRTIHGVVESHGIDGAILGSVRIQCAPDQRASVAARLARLDLRQLATRPNLVGATLTMEDAVVSAISNREMESREGPDERADWVILIEGLESDAVQAGIDHAAALLEGYGTRLDVGLASVLCAQYNPSISLSPRQ